MSNICKILMLLLLTVLTVVVTASEFSKEFDSLVKEIILYEGDNLHRFTYYYDNNGNITVRNQFKVNNNSSTPASRTEWIYSNGKCIGQIDYIANDGELGMAHKILYCYEDDKKESEVYFDVDNSVESVYKTVIYQYANDNISTILTFNGLQDESKLSRQLDYEYNSLNQLTRQHIKFFTDEEELHQVIEYKYNAQSYVDSLIVSTIESNEIENQLLTTFFYHSEHNLLVKQVQKIWDYSNAYWENITKIEYEYNSDLRLKKEFYYHFSNVFWSPNTKYEYYYDAEGLLSKKILYQPIYEKWRKISTITYSEIEQNKPSVMNSKYDFWGGETGSYVNSFIPFYFNDEMTIMQADRLELLYVLQTDDMTTMYKDEAGKVNIYPNPSNGIFYISTDKYRIESWMVYSLNGQIMKYKYNDYHTGLVDLSDLADGIYMLKANTIEGQELKQKIIIQRNK